MVGFRFWLDRWCGSMSLKEEFPSLFTIAASKEAWMREVWSGTGEGGSWAPGFSTHFNDWELEDVNTFMSRLH